MPKWDTPPRRLINAYRQLVKKKRSPGEQPPKQDSVTFEQIQVANEDGSYTVRDGPLPTTGRAQLRAGQIVPVARVGGKATAIFAHNVRRAQFHTAPALGGEIVEELFVGTDTTTGITDIYFRNDEQVTNLNIRSDLPSDPEAVRWGQDKKHFWVRCANSNSDAQVRVRERHKYHIFKISRSKTAIIGKQVPSATFVRTEDVLDSSITICSVNRQINLTRTRHQVVYDATIAMSGGTEITASETQSVLTQFVFKLRPEHMAFQDDETFPMTDLNVKIHITDAMLSINGDLYLSLRMEFADAPFSGPSLISNSASRSSPYKRVPTTAPPGCTLTTGALEDHSVTITTDKLAPVDQIEFHVALLNATQKRLVWATFADATTITRTTTGGRFGRLQDFIGAGEVQATDPCFNSLSHDLGFAQTSSMPDSFKAAFANPNAGGTSLGSLAISPASGLSSQNTYTLFDPSRSSLLSAIAQTATTVTTTGNTKLAESSLSSADFFTVLMNHTSTSTVLNRVGIAYWLAILHMSDTPSKMRLAILIDNLTGPSYTLNGVTDNEGAGLYVIDGLGNVKMSVMTPVAVRIRTGKAGSLEITGDGRYFVVSGSNRHIAFWRHITPPPNFDRQTRGYFIASIPTNEVKTVTETTIAARTTSPSGSLGTVNDPALASENTTTVIDDMFSVLSGPDLLFSGRNEQTKAVYPPLPRTLTSRVYDFLVNAWSSSGTPTLTFNADPTRFPPKDTRLSAKAGALLKIPSTILVKTPISSAGPWDFKDFPWPPSYQGISDPLAAPGVQTDPT